MKITTSSAVSTANNLAALFNSTSFTKGGKTYSAAVSDATVTFTATEEGETDTIPETVDVFTDEHLSKPVTTEVYRSYRQVHQRQGTRRPLRRASSSRLRSSSLRLTTTGTIS